MLPLRGDTSIVISGCSFRDVVLCYWMVGGRASRLGRGLKIAGATIHVPKEETRNLTACRSCNAAWLDHKFGFCVAVSPLFMYGWPVLSLKGSVSFCSWSSSMASGRARLGLFSGGGGETYLGMLSRD